jgi:hypothetical protein
MNSKNQLLKLFLEQQLVRAGRIVDSEITCGEDCPPPRLPHFTDAGYLEADEEEFISCLPEMTRCAAHLLWPGRNHRELYAGEIPLDDTSGKLLSGPGSERLEVQSDERLADSLTPIVLPLFCRD